MVVSIKKRKEKVSVNSIKKRESTLRGQSDRKTREKYNERYKRQQDIYDPNTASQKNIAIVGVGNIGSHVALALARLGVQNINLYDPDIIEVHNTTSQAYTVSDVGKFKVDVIAEEMKRINPDIIVGAFPSKYKAIQEDILIIGVDSLKARKSIYKSLINIPPNIIIDARIGGDQLEVYTMTTMDQWKSKLGFKPDIEPCGGRYICYVSIMTGAVITNQVKRLLLGEETQKEVLFHFGSYDILIA